MMNMTELIIAITGVGITMALLNLGNKLDNITVELSLLRQIAEKYAGRTHHE